MIVPLVKTIRLITGVTTTTFDYKRDFFILGVKIKMGPVMAQRLKRVTTSVRLVRFLFE